MFIGGKSKYRSIKDEVLLEKFRQSQDLEVLGALYRRYMDLVYGVCLKYLKHPEDSKDAVMQIFEKLIVEAEKTDIANFKSWLYVVSKNFCLMILRKEKSSRERGENFESFMEIAHDKHHDDRSQEQELEQTLAKAMLTLPKHQRTCLELFYYNGKSYHEIAQVTGYELKKVKSYIQNGRRNLKEKIKGE